MKLILLLTFLVACVGSAVIGIRLVRAGLKNRQAPEFTYGLALLLSATGILLRLIVIGILGGGAEYHGWMVGAACLRLVAIVALAWGIRVIFRASDTWAWGPMIALWLGGLAGLAVVIAYPGGFDAVGIRYLLGDVMPGFAVLWGALESFSYYRKMRRRLALGLADPLLVERFRIWGVGFSTSALATALMVGGTWWYDMTVTHVPWLLLVIQISMAMTTVATWIAFYPPAWLAARIRKSVDAGSATGVNLP